MPPEYVVKESARAKYLRIEVSPGGEVTVTKPVRTSVRTMERFVLARKDWIDQMVVRAHKRRGGLPLIELPKPRKGSRAHMEARRAARALVTERLQHFNTLYKTSYGTISIRDQKTRWGSCSHRNNLSFNYRIVFLPTELADYIIVHELCHTIEHNHSDKFWAQVARAIPNHLQLRKTLRTRYQS